MKLSPLQMKHYHFTDISLKARSGVKLSGKDIYPPLQATEVKTQVNLLTLEDDDPHEFIVQLEVVGNISSSNSVFPYEFHAAVDGFFTVVHDGDIEDRKRLVVCNGASILFGAVREQLLTLSARHRYGAFMLPSASFLGLRPKAEKNDLNAAPAAPKKKRVTKKAAVAPKKA